MNVLLDTHAAVWFFMDDDKMPESTKKAICNLDNVIHISIASLWEVAIKLSIGKLVLDNGFDGFLDAIYKNEFTLIEIEPKHIKAVMNLPQIHRDPFDRIIVAQAQTENMAVITADKNIMRYEIKTLW